MKKISLLLLLGVLISKAASAQNYDHILDYASNGTPSHGVKIKTNLPFVVGAGAPTITIKGYNYHNAEPISLTLIYYIWYQAPYTPAEYFFYNPKISSSGAYTPKVMLSNEGGKVVIFFQDLPYYQRFTISAYGKDSNEAPAYFEGWTVVDEPLTGDKTIEVPYLNRFKGQVHMPGTGIWNEQGKLGIGTIEPLAKIDVISDNYLPVEPGTGIGSLHIRPLGSATGQFTGITFGANQTSTNTAQAGIYIQSSGTYGTKMYFGTTDSYAEGSKKRMVIDHAGNVGIGTTDPVGYKLAVAGNMIAESVKVKPQTQWPDYVFAKSYLLPTLQETEKHIKEKGHLQGIPSAAEVKANGIDLGEMNVKLLKKIEELTLHLIEIKKEVKGLKLKIMQQHNQINQLKK